jgi:predicted metal-dependent hydrolase
MIDYTIRKSSRARRIRLSVTLQQGVVIVVPQYFDITKIPKIITDKEQWIRKAVAKVQLGNIRPLTPIVLPEKIHLKCNNSEYFVIVCYHSARKNSLSVDHYIITLSLDRNSTKAGFILLKKWLIGRAEEILTPWIRRVSIEHNLLFNSAVIRNQRTRWGSCSAKKNISLNRLLLFIPPHLVEYLFIHELCHTVELNHSTRYWALVEQHCPEYKALDKELKNVSRTIERWVY